LGYGGDRTEHVLWRLENGELDGYQPKLLILMIGTNNTGHRPAVQETPQDTADGIKAILELIARKSPSTKVLLLGIFPRGAGPSDAARIRNSQVNDLIKAYADGTRVTYMDLGPQMLESDGTLSREMMPDLLHPKEKGYGIWARAVLPVIKETLGK
jgi:lysophospholipase L1-like esterase